MSRLIELDPNMSNDQEPKDQEYGYYIFGQLTNVPTVQKVPKKSNLQVHEIDISTSNTTVDIGLTISQEELHQLQQQKNIYKRMWKQLQTSRLQHGNPYFIENDILMRNIIINKQDFQTMVLPRVLINEVLSLAHGELGHNVTTRT